MSKVDDKLSQLRFADRKTDCHNTCLIFGLWSHMALQFHFDRFFKLAAWIEKYGEVTKEKKNIL